MGGVRGGVDSKPVEGGGGVYVGPLDCDLIGRLGEELGGGGEGWGWGGAWEERE